MHVDMMVCYFPLSLNCKTFNMIYFLFPNFKLQNLFQKMDVLFLVLKALNFKDEISIRRGECNTPIKTNLFIRQNLFHRSNQQRFSIKVFNETQKPLALT
jgi:hypothetical protein